MDKTWATSDPYVRLTKSEHPRMESTMVAKLATTRRPAKTKPAPAMAEYVPIAFGPPREVTDEDFDKIEATLDRILAEKHEQLKWFKAFNAKMRRA